MADNTGLINRIVCRSVLPLMRVLYEEKQDSALFRALRGVDGSFQLAVKNSEHGAWLQFSGGECKVNPGVNPQADIAILFRDQASMNAMFTGGSPTEIGMPGLKGIWRLRLLIKTLPLLMGLTLLMPDKQPKDEDTRRLKVRMIMYMVANALSQLNKGGDEDMVKWTAKQPDRIYQFSVQPEGEPAAYLRVKGGKTKAGRGVYQRKAPFIHMQFNGIDGAYKVFAENKETVSAMADGDVALEGSPEYGGVLGSFMVRVSDLLLG
jgi:hypothetical protein